VLYAESMFPPMTMPIEGENAPLIENQRVILLNKRRELEPRFREEALKVASAMSGGDLTNFRFELPNLLTYFRRKVREQNVLPASFLPLFQQMDELVREEEDLPKPDRYYLKAMNCPHHHRIFAAEPRSYRDLPLRLAEYGTCYRYEQSGKLFGLMRGRMLNMNDAHIYCQPEKFAEEFNAVNEMYLKYFKIFGIEKYQMRFSTHDPAKLGQYQVVKSLGQAKPPGDLSVKRVAPLDIDNDPIWKWFNDIRDKGMKIKERGGARKNGSIVIYDTSNVEVARWNFYNAWPSKIASDSFSAGGTEAVSETITLVIERLERKK